MSLGPRTRFFLGVTTVFVVLGSLLRLAFYFVFRPEGATYTEPFYLGLKFDLRLALLLALPYLLMARFRPLDPARTPRAKAFWAGHYTFVSFLVLAVYVSDFGHYAYLEERLNASALRFLQNPLISAEMVWETYPVLPGAGVLLVLLFLLGGTFRILAHRAYRDPPARRSVPEAILRVAAGAVLVAAALYGKVSFYPLRWSDAFQSTERFRSDLGLNPVLFFLDTLCTDQEVEYDEDATRRGYERMARYLGVQSPDPAALDYTRAVRPTPLGEPRPNVVVILLESFAAHHCGAFGNPLDPSPNFDRYAKDGILYTNFFTPRHGTARAVFASLTGIPDVIRNRTATRNPRTIAHQTVLGDLEGYDKHYFLGGSVNWANIRGLLRNNIPGLHIHEEGSYTAPRIDVWGISDLHLFEEANRILREPRDRPFVAFLHASGNHRPYTIPEDNRGFTRREVDAKQLHHHGFLDLDEFNSFRFLDHAIGWFLDAASKESYFENTVFLLYGDNGTPGRADHMPPSEEELTLGAHHTPLLLYAPGRLPEGRRDDTPCGQADVMATVAGLVGASTPNTTLGRNLLDDRFAADPGTFVLMPKGPEVRIGIVDRTLFFRMREDGSGAILYDRTSKEPHENVAAAHPERFEAMKELCRAYYETARWMLYRNKPQEESR